MMFNGTRGLVIALLLSGTGALCSAQKLPRYLLSVSSVETTLRDAGLTVDAQQIAIPAGTTVAEEQPALAIHAAELEQGGRLRVRMACTHHSACNPFYATIAFSSGDAAEAALEIVRPATVQAAPALTRSASVIRPGEQTSMVLEDRQMRISLPVIAIDSGAVGTEVRVVSLDHKTTFRTIVVSSTLVRGVLP